MRGRERLAAELERMKAASPAAVLRLSGNPGAGAVRAAFLAMVKEFHPHRFAREPADVQFLANEIFLLVKAAYDALAATSRRRRRTTSPPAPRTRPDRAVRFRERDRRAAGGAPPDPGAPPPITPASPRRVANHSQLVAALETEDAQRERRLGEGIALVSQGRPAEAREIFRQLAIGNPADRRFRVHMHYAWGREHQGAGRLEDAAAEFRRALKLDPTFDQAAEALDSIAGQGDRTGVLGRLFRRNR